MRKVIFFGVFFLVFSLFKAQGQQENTVVLNQIIEEIAQNADAELDYTELYDDLQFFLENPLNLNSATKDDLLKFQFLTDFQIAEILSFRDRYGSYLTIYELQLIHSLSSEDIFRLVNFVKTEPVLDTKKQIENLLKKAKYGKHQVFARTQFVTQEQAGYIPVVDSILADNPNKNRYLGNKYKYYLRYKYKYKENIQMGVTMEKDPGEQFFAGHQQYGFDFYSAHLQVKNIGSVKTAIIGDYTAQAGQGLVMWTGLSSGKSSYVMNIRKRPRMVRKFSSVDENNFFRGAAVVLDLGKLDWTNFVSYKHIDANITNLDTIADEVREVSSLLMDGFHNTPSSIIDDNALGEFVVGSSAKYEHRNFQIGVSTLFSKYSAPLQKNITVTNQFEFMGDENLVTGADYQVSYTHSSFFGEAAISKNGGWAYLNGAQFHLAPQVSLSVLNRNYSALFQNLYAGAFAEGSKPQNEKGTYLGLEVHPYKYWKLSAYADFYTFPWLKTLASAPSGGQEFFAQLEYQPARNVYTYMKFKHETKDENIATDELVENVKQIANAQKSSFRYQIEYKVAQYWQLKNRIEFSFYKKQDYSEKGLLVYQDINFRPYHLPFNFSFRYAFIDSGWETRLYAYENDILYAFSVPAYYGKSTRMYLVSKYDITNDLTLWARYAITHFSDQQSVGTGLNESISPNRGEVKIQLRYSF